MAKKRLFILVAAVIALIGGAAWAHQLMTGLTITNMSNLFNWGLYIGLFAFLVGVAAGGMIISSAIHLFNFKDLKPFGLIASLTAFVSVVAAVIMVVVDLGKVDNVYHMILSPNFMSPLMWDFVVILAYMILTFLSVYFQLLPVSKRTGKMFLNSWVKDQSTESVEAFSNKWSRRVALVALPVAILIHAVTALIFATQDTHLWWHTAMLPIDFIAMAVASGGSLILMIILLIKGRDVLDQHPTAISKITKFIVAALSLHLFLMATEWVLLLWGGGLRYEGLTSTLFGDLLGMVLIETILPIFTLILLASKKTNSSPVVLVGSSIAVLIATFVHRMMLLYPALATPTLVFDVFKFDGSYLWAYPEATGRFMDSGISFTSDYSYFPTLLEFGVALFPIGIAILVLAFMMYRYPLIGSGEMKN